MTPRRLPAERKILAGTFPTCTLDTAGELVLGTLTANSGRAYSVRIDVPPSFPDAHPLAYITAPILYDRAGRKLACLGASAAMHTFTPRGDWVQVCHGHPQSWDSRNTLYTVLLKVRLWPGRARLRPHDGPRRRRSPWSGAGQRRVARDDRRPLRFLRGLPAMTPRVVVLHGHHAGPLAIREVDGGEVAHAEPGVGDGWLGDAPPTGTRLWVTDGASSARVLAGDSWADVPLIDATASTLARNGGVLESSLLAGASVAIVGLGSGGSLIADQLARAGVGELVLIDFDTLEASNVGRHLCDTEDLGRRKTVALADAMRRRVPGIRVRTADLDVVADPSAFAAAVADCHVLVGATDSNASRRVVNRLALTTNRPAIFGRAYTRACGGDVARVTVGGPCWECLFAQVVAEEEVASANSAGAVAYADAPARAEPGLALDIAPIAQMCARLVIAELVRGRGSALESLDDDLVGSFFLWANRRDGQFSQWPPMGYGLRNMAVQRWYAMRTPVVPDCAACGEERLIARLLAEAGV